MSQDSGSKELGPEPGPELGIAVIGFGWMGQAHSRAINRLSSLFPSRPYSARLVICAEADKARGEMAIADFGFAEATQDWRAAIEHPDVDVVYVCAPNMLHEPAVMAAAATGRHVFCEKPVGGTPAQTVRVHEACTAAGLVTGVGYNYRFAPLVQHTRNLIEAGDLGEITNYRGQFFSMFGSDPLGLLSWRFEVEHGGHGVSSDILSHAIDLAMMLNGPVSKVIGTGETFISQRPIAQPGASHYAVGKAGDPHGAVTNEDYFGALAVFENGSRGTFEASRTMFGPQSQMAFEVYGTKGAAAWNLEAMNEMKLWLADAASAGNGGYATVRAGEHHPYHSNFVPGEANPIGFEDLVTTEDHEYLSAVAQGHAHSAGFEQAVNYVSVQAALLRSWVSGSWEDVVTLNSGNLSELVPAIADLPASNHSASNHSASK